MIKYSPDADEFLKNFYEGKSATTDSEKIAALQAELGGDFAFHAKGGVPDKMKLACLEYDVLERAGKVTLDFS